MQTIATRWKPGSGRVRRDDVGIRCHEQRMELVGRGDVALLLGLIRHVEREIRRAHPLVGCAVMAGVGERTVAGARADAA